MLRILVTAVVMLIATAASAEKHFPVQRERMVASNRGDGESRAIARDRDQPGCPCRHARGPAARAGPGQGQGRCLREPPPVHRAWADDLATLHRRAHDEPRQTREGPRCARSRHGLGYQAAVLSRLVARVYTIEIVEPLAQEAAANLKRIGYDNVMVRAGDGYKGWPEHAPFDAIVVTAAANHVPQPLVDQLKPGGRLVIPVGATSMSQNLMVIEKDERGKAHNRAIIPVRFVPLTGEGEGGPPSR